MIRMRTTSRRVLGTKTTGRSGDRLDGRLLLLWLRWLRCGRARHMLEAARQHAGGIGKRRLLACMYLCCPLYWSTCVILGYGAWGQVITHIYVGACCAHTSLFLCLVVHARYSYTTPGLPLNSRGQHCYTGTMDPERRRSSLTKEQLALGEARNQALRRFGRALRGQHYVPLMYSSRLILLGRKLHTAGVNAQFRAATICGTVRSTSYCNSPLAATRGQPPTLG